MNSVDVQIKGSSGDALSLTITSSDTPERVADHLATITWIVRQVNGQAAEPRRRGPRQERPAAPALDSSNDV
ncbi:MAG: hypothetical protein QOK37_323 [Thermoanaerobaculia bacterium]|jgi:hypothetical protein|nr:hypothetical protein [Thermoanaerobaculia bacterium]